VSTYNGSFGTGAGSSLNALYSGASLSALSNSTKVDWVYDLGGLTGSTTSGSSDDNTKAVDAIMAAF
jgi:hypothetical protein